MNRRNFIVLAGGAIVATGGAYYLSSERRNFVRADIQEIPARKVAITDDERAILNLASLAPSGHNTQPWFVRPVEPYRWIVGNDRSRWLPGVDPSQRETMLSIGAFLQTLEYAAQSKGYACVFTQIARSNQDEEVAEVKLTKGGTTPQFDAQKIIERRILRSNYLNTIIKKEDIYFLLAGEADFVRYVPNTSKEHEWINEQTIEANRAQAYRDDAELELSHWIRFSGKDARAHCDGLTMASMELEGIAGWYLRNYYAEADVMKNSFRDQSIDTARKQVASSAGWLLIKSTDQSVGALLDTGRRLQRLLLKVRERQIAIHPMTQILEEPASRALLHSSIASTENLQFLLRIGYVKNYPLPVSLRRPVDWFLTA